MSCTFDRERIALHAGGDAPPEEAERAEEHLRDCPACRELLARYQQGMDLVAGHQAGARLPARARRPSRRWAAAAIVALLLLGGMGAATQSRAVAGLLLDLGWITVRVVSPPEWKQFKQEREDLWEKYKPSNFTFDADGKARDEQGNIIYELSTRGTLAEAEKAVGYQPRVPRYLPEGLVFSHAEYVPGRSLRDVKQVYGDGLLEVISMPEPNSMTATVPEGKAQVVTLFGRPAVLTRGAARIEENEERVTYPDAPFLQFNKDGYVFWLILYENGYPAEELIKIAQSME